ncbi:hypothetical protein [Peribacillus saganii]|nr:hypothetical protein [Peribacillus saganii]
MNGTIGFGIGMTTFKFVSFPYLFGSGMIGGAVIGVTVSTPKK